MGRGVKQILEPGKDSLSEVSFSEVAEMTQLPVRVPFCSFQAAWHTQGMPTLASATCLALGLRWWRRQ